MLHSNLLNRLLNSCLKLNMQTESDNMSIETNLEYFHWWSNIKSNHLEKFSSFTKIKFKLSYKILLTTSPNVLWENVLVNIFHAWMNIDAPFITVHNCITLLLTIPLRYVLVSINNSSTMNNLLTIRISIEWNHSLVTFCCKRSNICIIICIS